MLTQLRGSKTEKFQLKRGIKDKNSEPEPQRVNKLLFYLDKEDELILKGFVGRFDGDASSWCRSDRTEGRGLDPQIPAPSVTPGFS